MKYLVSGRWRKSGKVKTETIEAPSPDIAKIVFLIITGCVAESVEEIFEFTNQSNQ